MEFVLFVCLNEILKQLSLKDIQYLRMKLVAGKGTLPGVYNGWFPPSHQRAQ
jgi:hypothetical protein